jgi:hypothetical protein
MVPIKRNTGKVNFVNVVVLKNISKALLDTGTQEKKRNFVNN